MAVGSSEHFGDKPGELFDRHMLGEAMVVDPVGATLCIFNDFYIF